MIKRRAKAAADSCRQEHMNPQDTVRFSSDKKKQKKKQSKVRRRNYLCNYSAAVVLEGTSV